MEVVCLESIWTDELTASGWSSRAVAQLPLCLAASTLSAYNRVLRKLKQFCETSQVSFPPQHPHVLANFLCQIADESTAPRSQIKTVMAACSHLYAAYDLRQTLDNYQLQLLVSALIKSATDVPMRRTAIMPIKPFRDLFMAWNDNYMLSLKELRLKCITLMALVLMLRPSDIAPKAQHFVPGCSDATCTQFVFSTDNINFLESGEAEITFHGIKNDMSRTGFQVVMQPAAEKKLDPVQTLRDYINRTQDIRPVNNSVFLTLSPPYKAIAAATVAKIMNEAISLAGLTGYTAKCFRPTGATAAVDVNCDPEIVMRLGRWKTRSVFFDHYVHSKPPDTLTTDILDQ